MEDRGEEVEGGSVEEKVLVGEAGGLVRQVRREGGGTGRREEEGELPRWCGWEAERWVRWRRLAGPGRAAAGRAAAGAAADGHGKGGMVRAAAAAPKGCPLRGEHRRRRGLFATGESGEYREYGGASG